MTTTPLDEIRARYEVALAERNREIGRLNDELHLFLLTSTVEVFFIYSEEFFSAHLFAEWMKDDRN